MRGYQPKNLKVDVISHFYDIVKEGIIGKSCHYVAHNAIQNREDFPVASFSKDLDWPVNYWESYWNCDPLNYESRKITKMSACTNSPDRDMPENKKLACKMTDGFHFYIQHEGGLLENFSFWWEKYDISRISRQKLEGLCKALTELKVGHFRLNGKMFNTFPAVRFH